MHDHPNDLAGSLPRGLCPLGLCPGGAPSRRVSVKGFSVKGVCVKGGSWRERGQRIPPVATEAGGMHHTGMHKNKVTNSSPPIMRKLQFIVYYLNL